MRLIHPLVHRLRWLLRLPDHYHFYEDSEGMAVPGCGLCEEFLAELLTDETKRTTTPT